jgi:hypothetical protein
LRPKPVKISILGGSREGKSKTHDPKSTGNIAQIHIGIEQESI